MRSRSTPTQPIVRAAAVAAALWLGGAPGAHAQPLPTALPTFDPARWLSGAEVRIEEVAGGVALLGAARRGQPNTINPTTRIIFKDETTVRAVEATVTVLDGSARGTSFSAPALRIDGNFYWDGTGTGTATDQTGHVQADLRIAVRENQEQSLEVRCFVIRCLDPGCATFQDLFNANLGDVEYFQPHRLKVSFDFGTGDFRFQVDDQPPTVFTVADATRLAPTSPFMQIRARAGAPDGDETVGSMLALVEDVAVNGAPYDGFGATILPRAAVVPGSGPFPGSLTTDVVVAVETDGEPVSDVRLFLDGQDVSGFLAAAVPGTLPGGGRTFRFPAVLLAGVLSPGTTALVGVEATTPGGVVTGFALWEVVP
jgi:hypothetical protein